MKLMSLEIIRGLSGSPEGIEKLKTKIDKLLIFVLRLVPVLEPEDLKLPELRVSEHALTSLVNLSTDPATSGKMHSMHVIGRLMDYIREGSCPHHRLMVSACSSS